MEQNSSNQNIWEKEKWVNIKVEFFWLFFFLWMMVAFSCDSSDEETNQKTEKFFQQAIQNGEQAREGFIRSNAYMNAWLTYADSESRLIPRNLEKDIDIWNAQDCAADNYPFMVLTSFFTDQDKYHGVMREMLENEITLTSRVKSLPDTYSFTKKDFLNESVAMDRIIFGTSEYIKDGLLPLTEWLGHSPWSDRMLEMLRDMNEQVDVAGGLGDKNFGNSTQAEVNGELLQVLSRVYWMTGDQQFLEWAIQIGDHFLLGKEYPLTSFDYLRLRDHGCELISGLCELYVTLHVANRDKKNAYREPLYKLLDYILEHGRNEDGFFYNAINPQTGEVVDKALADTWGYTLNGFYSVYLVDSVDSYKKVVTKMFGNLNKYRDYDWEGGSADGYADAVEGALNLYNRIPDMRAADWIDSEIKVMWSMQDSSHRQNGGKWKDSGIIEGWHGDGNFARTSIMYNLWKSKGTYLQPWIPEISLGAEMKGDTLYMALGAQAAWKGKLFFDQARHSTEMNMPYDWPRINQFSEWYTIDPDKEYQLSDFHKGTSHQVMGSTLIEGIPLELESNETKWMTLSPLK